MRSSAADGKDRRIFEGETGDSSDGLAGAAADSASGSPAGTILVIGEEIQTRTLAAALNAGPDTGMNAEALWPSTDEGLDEDLLLKKVNAAQIVIGDPLFRTILRSPGTKLVEFPHEGYSGRIFRDRIPVFTGRDFDPADLL